MKQLLLILFVLPTLILAQKPIFSTAQVKSATVYSNAVQLVQNAAITLPKGNSEIVFKNIANSVNSNTIQINVPSQVTVLSVQFSDDYISEFEIDEQNPVIKKVRDSIKFVENAIQKAGNSRNTDQKTIELLDKNQQVWGSNSGLNVLELTKMVTYYQQNHTEISNNIDEKNAKIERLTKQLESLQNKLETNTQTQEKSSKGKLIVNVMNDVAGNIGFEINYISNNASWQPLYDLRVNSISDPINLEYKGQITQNTGIDWKKIKLSLSSGNPNQNNEPPTVNPWFLEYQQPRYSYKDESNRSVPQMLQGKLAGINITSANGYVGSSDKITIRGAGSIPIDAEPLYVVDGQVISAINFKEINPNRIKSVNVLKGANGTALYGTQGKNGVVVVTTKQGMDDYTTLEENQLNVSFDIDIPYDVLSNNKPHLVDLKTLKIPATFKSFAAPRSEKDAFLMAEIIDYGKYNLLPGEANIVFEGTYVGKIDIAANQTADTLSLSMGRDKKIILNREKIADKSGIKFLSSKKEQTFTFDITARNNKKEAVDLTIKDQYPLSSDKEIEIELLENSNAKINVETGILTWHLNLKPSESKKLRLSYKIRYPKDKVFGNL